MATHRKHYVIIMRRLQTGRGVTLQLRAGYLILAFLVHVLVSAFQQVDILQDMEILYLKLVQTGSTMYT